MRIKRGLEGRLERDKKESEVEGGFEEKVGEASLGVCFLCLISSAKPPPTPNPRGVGGWCRKKRAPCV